MKKVYFEYDRQHKRFKRIWPTKAQMLKGWLLRLLEGIALGCLAFAVFYILIPTPSLNRLEKDNSRLLAQYHLLSGRVDMALNVLSDIEERDDNLYRVILDADPLPEYVRQSGYSGANRYAELMDMTNAELVINTSRKIDLLEKKLYFQTKSFDDVVDLYARQKDRLDCIPAIQPVSNKDLKRTASGYGYRIDPIYHVRKHHDGMDFTCPTGTQIYVTGNGKVTYAKWKTGYGNCVEVDHGYGFMTRYAHMSKINVRQGQTVSRGEVIGLVGSTGKSTGPHLHYEVYVNGRHVNPVNYYFMDLDVESYEKMIQMSENQGRVYD